MTDLIEEYNSWSHRIYKLETLQEKLENITDPQLKDLCGCRKAAVWIEIFNKLTELEGFVPDTVIVGVIQRAIEKYSNEPDTPENVALAILAAECYNTKKSKEMHEFFSFIGEVERVFSDAFTPTRAVTTVWRPSREL